MVPRNAMAFFTIVILCLIKRTASLYGVANPEENATTNFLDSLLKDYDGRIRPNFNRMPVIVNISMQIGSIGHIAETTMDYRVTIFLRQLWNDPRLSHNVFKDEVVLDVSLLKKLWVPDLFVVNEKLANFHTITKDNKLLRLDPLGNILLSMRLSLTLTCNMKLHRFPMDSQECGIKLESYAYRTTDIEFRWVLDKPLQVEKSVELPQFFIVSSDTKNCTRRYTTGTYPCVEAVIRFQRQTGYYLIQTYIPTFLIVCLSWISFWIDSSASTARVALGITTVLTMTTQTSAAQESLPRVSYVKAIDVWMAVCLLFVFSALLEFSAVNFLGRLADARKAKRKKAKELLRRLDDENETIGTTVFQNSQNDVTDNSYRLTNHNNSARDSPCSCNHTNEYAPITNSDEVHRERLTPRVEIDISSRIDSMSRIVFPLAFACFNFIYWIFFILGKDVHSDYDD